MKQMLCLRSSVPGLIVSGRVLKSPTARAVRSAAALLEVAQKQVTALLEDTRQQQQVMLKETQEASQAHFQKQKKKHNAALVRTIAKLKEQYLTDLREQRPYILEAIVGAVRNILADAQPEAVAAAYVDKSLRHLSQAHSITIYVREENIASLQKRFAKHPLSSVLQFSPESKLELTDSIVECDIGTIHNRLDVSIEALESALKEQLETLDSPS